jgi:hypothetical protein
VLISNASSEVFAGKFDQAKSGDEPTPSQVKGAVSAVPKLLVNENVPPEEVCTPPPPLPLPLQAIKDEIRALVMKAITKCLDAIKNH